MSLKSQGLRDWWNNSVRFGMTAPHAIKSLESTLALAGFAIVPLRLTPEMIVAACNEIENDGTGFTEAWAAAIAAAPK